MLVAVANDVHLILDPTIQSEDLSGEMAPRLNTLNGVTLGLLANGKFNGDRLLDFICEQLETRYRLARVVRFTKTHASVPLSPELLRDVVSTCSAVITAVGD